MKLILKKIKTLLNKRKFTLAKLSSVTLLSLLIFIFSAQPAKAIDFVDIGLDVFYKLITSLVYLINNFLGYLVTLGSEILNGIINVGRQPPPAAIKTGWSISLGFTNTIFIFGLLYIAFATIFRIEQYGAKKLLPIFIIVALLINFSFFLSMQIFNLSNDLASSIPIKDAGIALADSVNLQAVWKSAPQAGETEIPYCYFPKNDQTKYSKQNKNCIPNTSFTEGGVGCFKDSSGEGEICDINYYRDQVKARADSKKAEEGKSPAERFMSMTISLLFSVIFMLIMLFIILAYAVFFIVRIIGIWVLLVIAPMAWAFMIFPKTQTYSTKWWNKFIEYSFFAPVALFFLYLSLSLKTEFDATASAAFNTQMTSGGFSGLLLSHFMAAIAIGGFSIAGLIVAQQLGIAGASKVSNLGEKAGAWAAKGAAKGAATRALASIPGRVGAPARTQLAMQKIERKEKGVLGFKGRAAEAEKTLAAKVESMKPEEQQKLAGIRQFTPARYAMRQAAEKALAKKSNYYATLLKEEPSAIPMSKATGERMSEEELKIFTEKKRKINEAKQALGIKSKKKKGEEEKEREEGE